MGRRKDFTSLLRNMERPSERGIYIGVASSISSDGKTINGQNFSDSEVRDLLFALPYGISSSGIDGIRIEIIKNDNQNNVAVGVIDDKRPPVKSGCITIYDKSGSSIALNGDGSVTIKANTITINGNIDINGNGYINGKKIAVQGDSISCNCENGSGSGTID